MKLKGTTHSGMNCNDPNYFCHCKIMPREQYTQTPGSGGGARCYRKLRCAAGPQGKGAEPLAQRLE